ncbi:MAG: LicD family protein [Lachnospiraceae bacterium]|nr:LicD family protein [Lachnospiraceae bacterium]
MQETIYDRTSPNDPAIMDRIHDINLESLEELKRIAEKHGITYYVAYGALLGSLRYKDFIPWDNDVDVMITRGELEKLLRILPEELDSERFFLVTPDMYGKHYRDIVPFIAYKKARIKLDPEVDAFYNHLSGYITLDFFILDRIPDDRKGKFLQDRLMLLVAMANGHRMSTNYADYHGILKVAAFVLGAVGKLIPASYFRKRIAKVAAKYNDDPRVTTYAVTNDNMTSYSMRISVSDFEGTQEIELRGKKYPAAKSFDEALRQYYGDDYMTPPPYEKRTMHLGFMRTTGDDRLYAEDFIFED